MVYRIFLYVSIGNVFNLMVLGWKIVMFMEVVLFYLWERVDGESDWRICCRFIKKINWYVKFKNLFGNIFKKIFVIKRNIVI